MVVLSLTLSFAWWRSRPVQIELAPAAANPVCAELAGALPRAVRGTGRVPTSSASLSVAAWGRPAVIWRCGVTPPGPTELECVNVDGVDWLWVPLRDGSSFVTYGREPAVQVLVPRTGSPDPLVLPAFSRVVARLPQGARSCS